MNEYDRKFKIMIVGQEGVGKTQIFSQASGSSYTAQHTATLGLSFTHQWFFVGDEEIKLQIWDTGGTEKYYPSVKKCSSCVDVVLLCYDISDQESLYYLSNYIDMIQDKSPGVKFILVGNKSDLDQENRQISINDVVTFSKQNIDPDIVHIMEVSAKTGDGIDDLFVHAARLALNPYDEKESYIQNNMPVDFDTFIEKYNRAYSNDFFKNFIKGPQWQGEHTIDEIVEYATQHPQSRTAKVYNAIIKPVDTSKACAGCSLF